MTHDELREQLKALLLQARDAAAGADVAKRFKVSDALMDFVERSAPNDDMVRAMDEIASKAAVDLLEQTIDERLKSLAARNAELAALTKQVHAAGEQAKADAAAIRLKKVGETLDALNASMAALKSLRDELKAGPDDAVIAKVASAAAALRGLRNVLEA